MMKALYLPPHMGDTISVRGMELKVDENRLVSVPLDNVEDLLGHGLQDPAHLDMDAPEDEVAVAAPSRPKLRKGR